MPDFEAQLRALEQRFRDSVPDKLDQLAQALQACSGNAGDAASMATLHRLLHTLAGSAGTFGEIELGERARQVETLFKPMLQAPHWNAQDLAPAACAMEQFIAWAKQA